MRLLTTLTAFAAFSTLAFAEDRTIQLTNPVSTRGMQEIATILRTVGDLKTLSLNDAHTAFVASGTPAELDCAEWIVHQADRPANWQPSEQERNNPATREYRGMPAGSVIRAYRLMNTAQPRAVQETLTVLRTVLDIQKIFNYSDLSMLVYRGTAAQVDAVDWVLNALDAPAGTPLPSEPWKLDSKPFDLLRVYGLPKGTTTEQLAALITELRTKESVMKVFSRSEPPVLVVAATAAMLDRTGKAVAAMERP